jgi:gliding motility-associated-like protein
MFKFSKIVLVVLQALFFIYANNLKAQEEVIYDPGFDDYTPPTSQIYTPFDWFHQLKFWYNPNILTPDYFCGCNYFGQPNNLLYNDYRTSIGIFVYSATSAANNTREYFGTTLKKELNINKHYYVSFSISPFCLSHFGINRIGILFTENKFTTNDSIISMTPQVSIDSTIFINQFASNPDSNNWQTFKFIYIPEKVGLKNIIVGNFYSDDNTDTLTHVGQSCCPGICSSNYRYSYYSFDYVSIKEYTDNKNLTINDTTICSNTGIILSNKEPAAGHTYSWYTKDGFVSNELNVSVSPNISTTYYLYTTDAFDNECNCNPPVLDSVWVTVINAGIKITNKTDGELCAGDTMQIGLEPINNYKYSWQPNTYLSKDTIANPYIHIPWYLENEKLEYNLIVTDTNGRTCTLKNNWAYIFNVSFCPDSLEPQIYIPNVFSPNGDGENDEFKLTSQNIKNLKAAIYNRWGIPINTINGIEEKWQGKTIAGDNAPAGIYYVIITAEGMDKNTYYYSGYVHLY